MNNKEINQSNALVIYKTIPKEQETEVQIKDNHFSQLFLRFSFNTQYEIGLTSNLFRPHLINNSRTNKQLGDKLLFSSGFIIDHILKFHPFGFSWRNLELIPEVILVNKEPKPP